MTRMFLHNPCVSSSLTHGHRTPVCDHGGLGLPHTAMLPLPWPWLPTCGCGPSVPNPAMVSPLSPGSPPCTRGLCACPSLGDQGQPPAPLPFPSLWHQRGWGALGARCLPRACPSVPAGSPVLLRPGRVLPLRVRGGDVHAGVPEPAPAPLRLQPPLPARPEPPRAPQRHPEPPRSPRTQTPQALPDPSCGESSPRFGGFLRWGAAGGGQPPIAPFLPWHPKHPEPSPCPAPTPTPLPPWTRVALISGC